MKNNNMIRLRDGTNHHRIINGCWQLSQGHGKQTISSLGTLKLYIEKGFNTFDGADIYTGVEEVFGIIKSKYGDVDKVRFHTKHVPNLDDINSGNISEEKTIEQISHSCQKMQTSKLSNVQFHWWDYNKKGYDISISTLIKLQQQGIIEHIGVTNTNVDFLVRLEKELGFIPMSSQNQYSIIDRRPENKLIPHLQNRNIGLYCYGSLMGGLLSEKYLGAIYPMEPLKNRSLRKYLRILDDWGDWELFQELLTALQKIGVKHNVSLSEIAIAWVLCQRGVNSVIVGVGSHKHITSLDKIMGIVLDTEDIKSIDTIYEKGASLAGDVFDLERYEERHRDIMKFNLNKIEK